MAKLIIANWKMNGSYTQVTKDLNIYLNQPITNQSNVVLALPTLYLAQASSLIKPGQLKLASQDVSQFTGYGAYTGEVSSLMLAEFGISYCLVGHSERRTLFNENGSILANKITNLINNNIVPIFCLGEAQDIRHSNKHLDFLALQLELLIEIKSEIKQLIIAYEPIWAIGSGLIPTSLQISEVANLIHAFVQSYLPYAKILVVYGGSVSSKNVAAILKLPQIDGVLVGGASLKVDEFTAICSYG